MPKMVSSTSAGNFSFPSGSGPEAHAYVAEDGVTFYVAENGTDKYVPEV